MTDIPPPAVTGRREFLNGLREMTRAGFKWKLTKAKRIRVSMTVSGRGCMNCPLTALNQFKGGRYMPQSRASAAANELGILHGTYFNPNMIMLAADNLKGNWRWREEHDELRRDMLEACGLEKPA